MASYPYAAQIQGAAQRYGVDPALLAGLIRAESGFNPNARSSTGALGLGQLMPATARGLGVTNPLDPAQSIAGAARYLSDQLRTFGGDVTKAVAAYNAGPGAVQRYNGVPPYAETQAYVPRVLSYAKGYGYGSGPPTTSTPAASSKGITTFFALPVLGAKYSDDFNQGTHSPSQAGYVWQDNGIDLFAPAGTPVRAPFAGKLTAEAAGGGNIGGNRFELTGLNGLSAYGAHLEGFAGVKPGQTINVRAGQVIGYVGNTGNAAGGPTHLHFSIGLGGKALNPFPWLSGAATTRGGVLAVGPTAKGAGKSIWDTIGSALGGAALSAASVIPGVGVITGAASGVAGGASKVSGAIGSGASDAVGAAKSAADLPGAIAGLPASIGSELRTEGTAAGAWLLKNVIVKGALVLGGVGLVILGLAWAFRETPVGAAAGQAASAYATRGAA